MLIGSGPQVLSGPGVTGTDAALMNPVVERLMNFDPDFKGIGLEPVLAEKVDDDIANKRIVFHLRPGVKFHDGTDLNADVVIWTFQRLIEAGRLQYASYWSGIRKLDDLTVEINYTKYSNQLIQSWGLAPITSKIAYDKGSNGDPQKGLDWERTHCVGTGPFILQEYKRDDYLNYVKNPDYWQTGKPFLDGLEIRIIPDSMVAQTLTLAGEADYLIFVPWNSSGQLAQAGFKLVTGWPGNVISIFPNTSNPKSKWNDIRLRQALDYALDKSALIKAFRQTDIMLPMAMLAPPGEWGYDPNYPARNYDPQKARGLIQAAGYAPPLKAQLLVSNDFYTVATATALKGYLDAAGFEIELDLADSGRLYGTVYGNSPGPDLSMTWSTEDINYLMSYLRWFSTDPLFELSYLGHTPEQKLLDEQAKIIPDSAGQKLITDKIIRYMTDEARVIPIFVSPVTFVSAPYVHTAPYLGLRWMFEDIWMDKQ
jgi:peptide/nickel transport system substrate-binding protein